MDGAVWRIRRRPYGPLAWAAPLIAIALGTAGAGLFQLIQTEPDWRWSLLAGGLLALATGQAIFQGSCVWIDPQRILHYTLGRREICRLPLAAITGTRLIRTGLLRGVGLVVDPGQVTVASRMAMTRTSLERHQADLGTSVVLEHLTESDRQALDQLRAASGP